LYWKGVIDGGHSWDVPTVLEDLTGYGNIIAIGEKSSQACFSD
jgi:hypothetical protein